MVLIVWWLATFSSVRLPCFISEALNKVGSSETCFSKWSCRESKTLCCLLTKKLTLLRSLGLSRSSESCQSLGQKSLSAVTSWTVPMRGSLRTFLGERFFVLFPESASASVLLISSNFSCRLALWRSIRSWMVYLEPQLDIWFFHRFTLLVNSLLTSSDLNLRSWLYVSSSSLRRQSALFLDSESWQWELITFYSPDSFSVTVCISDLM